MTSPSGPNQSISSECEVTLNDQKLINRFARLNAKCEELQIDINYKKRQLDNIEEAINEIMIADNPEDIYVQTGEVFAHLDTDSANNMCEDKKKQIETNLKEINSSLDLMKEEMSQIKVTLYAKFGNNINLEYDDEN